MMVEYEELLARSLRDEVDKSVGLGSERHRREHEIDEEDNLCCVDLGDGVQVRPCFVILSSDRIDDCRNVKRGDRGEIATDLLGNDVSVTVGMADDENVLHGTQPSAVASGTGIAKDTFA